MNKIVIQQRSVGHSIENSTEIIVYLFYFINSFVNETGCGVTFVLLDTGSSS